MHTRLSLCAVDRMSQGIVDINSNYHQYQRVISLEQSYNAMFIKIIKNM